MSSDMKPAHRQFLRQPFDRGALLEILASLPSSYELHRRAQRERSLVINALLRSATREFVKWLTVLASGGVKRARELTDEWRRRREIRALLRFDDRALADMGLGRSEIEFVVRTGRHLANQISLPRGRVVRRTPARGQPV